MSLRQKIILCFCCIFVFFGISYSINYWKIKELNDSLGLLSDGYLPLLQKLIAIQTNTQALRDRILAYQETQKIHSPIHMNPSTTFDPNIRFIKKKERLIIDLVNDFHSAHPSEDPLSDLTLELGDLNHKLEQISHLEDFSERYHQIDLSLRWSIFHLETLTRIKIEALKQHASHYLFLNSTLSSSTLIFGILLTLLSIQTLSPLTQLIKSINTITTT